MTAFPLAQGLQTSTEDSQCIYCDTNPFKTFLAHDIEVGRPNGKGWASCVPWDTACLVHVCVNNG